MVGLVGLLPLPRVNCRECHPLGQFTREGLIEPTNPTKPTSHAGPELRRVLATSVKVVELGVAELATDQAALGGSCRVSLAGGGLSNSPMASTPM